MRMAIFCPGATLAAACVTVLASPGLAQRAIPIRVLSRRVATDSGLLQNIAGIRQLPDGRVLVNDATWRRLLAFDSTLSHFTVVLDTAGGAGEKYGKLGGALIPYLGDSTLFVDSDSRVFVLLDPRATVVRTIAPAHVDDLGWISNGYYGTPGVDKQGRLIYRTHAPIPPGYRPPPAPTDSNPIRITAAPDSAPVVRADFETRTVDTLARMAIGAQRSVMAKVPGTRSSVGFSAFNPLPSSDEWTVTSDGTLVIARVHDYHIDWIHTDGSITSSPKMPFDWRPISLDEKTRIIDSVRRAHDDYQAAHPSPRTTDAEIAATRSVPIPFVTVNPADLPDFYPPIRRGQVKADADGNVWILPATSALASTPGLVWDVINPKGEVVEHVRLPDSRNIAGFGRGGVVYLSFTANGATLLERAHIVR